MLTSIAVRLAPVILSLAHMPSRVLILTLHRCFRPLHSPICPQGVLSKLSAAKEMMREFLEREKRKQVGCLCWRPGVP